MEEEASLLRTAKDEKRYFNETLVRGHGCHFSAFSWPRDGFPFGFFENASENLWPLESLTSKSIPGGYSDHWLVGFAPLGAHHHRQIFALQSGATTPGWATSGQVTWAGGFWWCFYCFGNCKVHSDFWEMKWLFIIPVIHRRFLNMLWDLADKAPTRCSFYWPYLKTLHGMEISVPDVWSFEERSLLDGLPKPHGGWQSYLACLLFFSFFALLKLLRGQRIFGDLYFFSIGFLSQFKVTAKDILQIALMQMLMLWPCMPWCSTRCVLDPLVSCFWYYLQSAQEGTFLLEKFETVLF